MTWTTHRPSILLTQPWETLSCLLMSQGLTPPWESSTILCLIWSGRGLPFTKRPPSWLTPPCPRLAFIASASDMFNATQSVRFCAQTMYERSRAESLSRQGFYAEPAASCMERRSVRAWNASSPAYLWLNAVQPHTKLMTNLDCVCVSVFTQYYSKSIRCHIL